MDNQVLYHFSLHHMYMVHSTYVFEKLGKLREMIPDVSPFYNHNMYIL